MIDELWNISNSTHPIRQANANPRKLMLARSTDLAKVKAIRTTEHAAEIMFEGLPMAVDRLHSEIEEAANDRPARYRRGEIEDVQKRHAALVG